MSSYDDIPKRKRRKPCGNCSGCNVKQNCGVCGACEKRKVGKQKCKMRRCIKLLTRPSDAPPEKVKEESVDSMHVPFMAENEYHDIKNAFSAAQDFQQQFMFQSFPGQMPPNSIQNMILPNYIQPNNFTVQNDLVISKGQIPGMPVSQPIQPLNTFDKQISQKEVVNQQNSAKMDETKIYSENLTLLQQHSNKTFQTLPTMSTPSKIEKNIETTKHLENKSENHVVNSFVPLKSEMLPKINDFVNSCEFKQFDVSKHQAITTKVDTTQNFVASNIAQDHQVPSTIQPTSPSKPSESKEFTAIIASQVETTQLSSLPGFQKSIYTNSAPQNQASSGRKTPEIYEPRISFESEHTLVRKVRPNGSVDPLPSFKTFAQELNLERKAPKSFAQALNLETSLLNDLKSHIGNYHRGRKLKIKELKPEVLKCGCTIKDVEADAPFYDHLGSGRTLEEFKATLLTRFGIEESALRLVFVQPTNVEGKNGDGCPLAKWILRRTGTHEKYLVIARHHPQHSCTSAYRVVCTVAWEGIAKKYADDMYKYLTTNLNEAGFRVRRRCGANDSKTCMCQGEKEDSQGASFTFGCSWSMYYDGCKFTRSKHARKFKMQHPQKEEEVEKVLQDMATQVSPLLKIWAPKAYANMTQHDSVADDCRIGLKEGRPFSGVTCCLDFCAHSHKDMHNLSNGTTMVCTLLKPDYNERTDEQLHVLPLYQPVDEHGNVPPPDYQNPAHMMQSKITNRRVTEGKGKYVNPVAVGTQKSSNFYGPAEPINDSLQFCNDNQVQALRSEWVGSFHQSPVKNEETQFVNENTLPSLFQNGESPLKTGYPADAHASPSDRKRKEHVSKLTNISPEMGGVAIALGHGSFIIECAKKELHATTALSQPDRNYPSRLSMVFYQHKKLNKVHHGFEEYQVKLKQRLEEKRLKNLRSLDDLSLLPLEGVKNMPDWKLNASFDNLPDGNNPLLALCDSPLLKTSPLADRKTDGEPVVERKLFTDEIVPLINVWGKTEKLPTFSSIFNQILGKPAEVEDPKKEMQSSNIKCENPSPAQEIINTEISEEKPVACPPNQKIDLREKTNYLPKEGPAQQTLSTENPLMSLCSQNASPQPKHANIKSIDNLINDTVQSTVASVVTSSHNSPTTTNSSSLITANFLANLNCVKNDSPPVTADNRSENMSSFTLFPDMSRKRTCNAEEFSDKLPRLDPSFFSLSEAQSFQISPNIQQQSSSASHASIVSGAPITTSMSSQSISSQSSSSSVTHSSQQPVNRASQQSVIHSSHQAVLMKPQSYPKHQASLPFDQEKHQPAQSFDQQKHQPAHQIFDQQKQQPTQPFDQQKHRPPPSYEQSIMMAQQMQQQKQQHQQQPTPAFALPSTSGLYKSSLLSAGRPEIAKNTSPYDDDSMKPEKQMRYNLPSDQLPVKNTSRTHSESSEHKPFDIDNLLNNTSYQPSILDQHASMYAHEESKVTQQDTRYYNQEESKQRFYRNMPTNHHPALTKEEEMILRMNYHAPADKLYRVPSATKFNQANGVDHPHYTDSRMAMQPDNYYYDNGGQYHPDRMSDYQYPPKFDPRLRNLEESVHHQRGMQDHGKMHQQSRVDDYAHHMDQYMMAMQQERLKYEQQFYQHQQQQQQQHFDKYQQMNQHLKYQQQQQIEHSKYHQHLLERQQQFERSKQHSKIEQQQQYSKIEQQHSANRQHRQHEQNMFDEKYAEYLRNSSSFPSNPYHHQQQTGYENEYNRHEYKQ